MSGENSDRNTGDGGNRLNARLAVSLSGTNLERAADYNQRTVLQAIRLAEETTRVELAKLTGLTTPTIGNITTRLIEAGMVRLIGRKQGGRGQPPSRLAINAEGCFGIGLNIDRDHVTMLAIDLAGEVRARVELEVDYPTPDDVLRHVREQLDGLLAAGGISRDRVLGVGVALPDDLGRVTLPSQPEHFSIWAQTDISQLLGGVLHWPIYYDNDAALAAFGEAQYGVGRDHPSFFYLLVNSGLGGGLVVDRHYYRGATLRSGEIGFMPDLGGRNPAATVQDTVSLAALRARLDKAGCHYGAFPDIALDDPLTRFVATQWIEEATCSLLAPFVAINCLVNPDAIVIGGRLPVTLLSGLVDSLIAALEPLALPSKALIRSASMARDAPAMGAAILPFLDKILPSDAALIQAGRSDLS